MSAHRGVIEGLGGRAAGPSRPWARRTIDAVGWGWLGEGLRDGLLDLVSLWGEPGQVHAAVREGATLAVFSLATADGAYPALSAAHPPAGRLERAAADMVGLRAEGAPDDRPWLDHGRWGLAHPMGERGASAGPGTYRFLPVEGEGLHEVAVGPVHAGVIEPGHFRFTANGETVARLEQRLGYTHKGVLALMAGSELGHAARLAGRVSGDSTVAYAFAFALAVEAAAGVEAPAAARRLRGVMAELERVANHLGDIGAICNDASFSLLHAHLGVLRERVLRASAAAFGHRLMMDRVVPGGVAAAPADGGEAAIAEALREIRREFPNLVQIYDETNSLQDRTVGTGVVSRARVERFAAGGYVGRASGRGFDARRWAAYAPYDGLVFEPPVMAEGDVNARVWVRIREVEQSLELLDRLMAMPAAGAVRVDVPAVRGKPEGLALVEGFRGDIFAWVRLAPGGRLAACHLRDPSWFHWPLLEGAVEGNIIADFPLCNKSFNGSYSGQDL